jgi:hypothetical protein
MPVIDSGAIFPKPNVTVEAPSDPETVEFDAGGELADKDKVDLSGPTTVDHSDLHTPRGTGFAEVPGPVSVVLEGYGVEGETTSPQVKLVESKPRAKGKGTSSAETK